MSKVTQHTHTSYFIAVMSKSESRAVLPHTQVQLIKTCLESSDSIEVKMLIVENVTETEADGLRRIIEQQASEIVKLENKIRFLE